MCRHLVHPWSGAREVVRWWSGVHRLVPYGTRAGTMSWTGSGVRVGSVSLVGERVVGEVRACARCLHLSVEGNKMLKRDQQMRRT